MKISDLELGNGLIWTDRWGQQNVSQKTIRTLGGLPVLYHAKLYAGVPITIESLEDQGWQTLATVQRLYEMASVAGAQYLLDLGPTQFSVMFRHDDLPAFDATPLIPRTLADAADYFTIKLKLITV